MKQTKGTEEYSLAGQQLRLVCKLKVRRCIKIHMQNSHRRKLEIICSICIPGPSDPRRVLAVVMNVDGACYILFWLYVWSRTLRHIWPRSHSKSCLTGLASVAKDTTTKFNPRLPPLRMRVFLESSAARRKHSCDRTTDIILRVFKANHEQTVR